MIILKTKEEVQEFLKGTYYADSLEEYYDGGMNFAGHKIFEKDGKLYAVDYINGNISSGYYDKDRNYQNGYAIYPVKKKVEMIEHVTYDYE